MIQDEAGTRVGEALAPEHQVGEVFLAALVGRDFPTIEACFHPEVTFRALILPSVREAETAQQATAYLGRWFGDADHHELLDGWQVVEQQAYCDVQDGKITRMDLLCSGFRPCGAPDQGTIDHN
jgi:hypothetical protein